LTFARVLESSARRRCDCRGRWHDGKNLRSGLSFSVKGFDGAASPDAAAFIDGTGRLFSCPDHFGDRLVCETHDAMNLAQLGRPR
jgi:hypothetical protein